MNILVAFLAFSAIMIVLSTLATTIVEGIHKFSRQRSKDFERNYYIGSVAPLLQEKGNGAADHFVKAIKANPAFEREKETETRGLLGKIKKRIFDTDFETLTTPQYIEQLARSPIAEKVSAKLEQGEDAVIQRLAAEFERYGDGAQDYFKRRAQVLSICVAVMLAFFLNVDAIRIFKVLASDAVTANTIVDQFDIDEWEAKYTAAKSIAADDANVEAVFKNIKTDLNKDIQILGEWSLPIGQAFFPMCDQFEDIRVTVDENGKLLSQPVFKRTYTDSKCNIYLDLDQRAAKDKYSEELTAKANTEKAPFLTKVKHWFISAGDTLCYAGETFLILVKEMEFWSWLLNSFLAGLLIGLGAPFWFKTYRSLADFVPGVRRGAKTETRTPLDDQADNIQPQGGVASSQNIIAHTTKLNLQKGTAVSLDTLHTGVVNQSQLSALYKSVVANKPTE
jgi:hypothetical protein